MPKNSERFENHMDVSGGEMSGDAEKVSEYSDNPEDFTDEFESKMKQSKRSPISLERAMTYVTTLESIVNAFNNYRESAIKEKKEAEIPPPLTSISTNAYPYMESTTEDIISQKGYKISQNESSSPIEKAKTLIEAIGSDDDEALSTPEELMEQRKQAVEENLLSNNSLEGVSSLDKPPSLPAFSSIVSENFEYGQGGGLQLFIPNANEYKENGTLVKIAEYYDDISTRENAVISKPIMAQDENEVEDVTIADEILYLDNNTIDTEGLNMVVDANGNMVDPIKEDYLHPHSNQEDSNGKYYPDSWKPTDIKSGTILYQLSTNGDTQSCYFTDQSTIDQCTHNGNVDFSELRDKLQILDGDSKICLSVYKCKL